MPDIRDYYQSEYGDEWVPEFVALPKRCQLSGQLICGKIMHRQWPPWSDPLYDFTDPFVVSPYRSTKMHLLEMLKK